MNTNYVDLFRRVAKSMKLDYAAHDVWEDRDHTTRFIDELTFYVMHSVVSDVRFARIVSKYLACFNDPHVRFWVDHERSPYKRHDYGVALRRFGDALYVEASANPCFRQGDRIFSADYRSIAELASMHAPCLFGEESERQLWEEVFHFCETASIEREGELIENAKLDKVLAPLPRDENAVSAMEEGIVLVSLHRLENEGDIAKLIADHAETLRHARGIVLDIRDCTGSCDAALASLAPLVADAGMRVSDFLEETCLVNFSERNCELLEQSLASAAGEPWADDLLQETRRNRGKGFVPFSCDVLDELCRAVEPLTECPVAVLVDRRCSGSAEVLVELCKAASRCVLVGRNTSGSLGTSFPLLVPINERFILEYPIARFDEDGLRRHGSGTGVGVDVFVPWSPEHLRRDVDMKTARGVLADGGASG